ncbi:hypothetical protein TTHERM_00421080 (macronuclear) [Tetrahymena thermophila SB210]|uniref:Uncharacterized protein n=1 Tax=Tetrahymena thermophila (strain SB210) TaxID=312017 RepID=I7M091_TETTS|nr:hypothetical protein TTHERM_00421080 [Tetrahymena thermophila SB210]EAR85699.2 hypothetical protein TTHERM_00421080 [Tetrahymena thermophila SB210]|eukprot:XP_001033362.2 hypothetical protein TTHERM_00421080 [Tetrahymena thermophila SB210]
MRRENLSYIGSIFSDEQAVNQQFPILEKGRDLLQTAIQWKISKDYQSLIQINFIFKVIDIEIQEFKDNKTQTEQYCACSQMTQRFLQQFNTFKSQLLIDENTKCVDKISVNIKKEENPSLEIHIPCINKFLVSIDGLLLSLTNLKFDIEADYQWSDFNFQEILVQAQSLEINDIYSYFPLSNYKYPMLKRILINPEPSQQNISKQLAQGKDDLVFQQKLQESFSEFLSCINLKQINFILIDGCQYPELIKTLLNTLFNTDKSNIKRLEFDLNIDSQQFHVIFSLSNLHKIYPSCQISVNYIIDFSPLLNSKKTIYEPLDKQSQDKQNNQQDRTDINQIQSVSDFPYLFKEIYKNFENICIKLVFKNLKSLDQLELFDRIKSNHEHILDYQNQNLNKLFSNMKVNNKINQNNKIFAQLTSLIHKKITEMHQQEDSIDLASTIDQNYVKEQSGSKIGSLMKNLGPPLLSLFGVTQPAIVISTITHFMINKQRNLAQKNQENSQKEEFFQQLFPSEPLSLFKTKQNFRCQTNDSNNNQNALQSKQIVQQQTNQTNQILSKYFLPYQTNEIITLELILENTVFGSNYIELFDFISKCNNLKKFTLLNFCLQDNFGSQQNISQQVSQRQKTDTQQAMHVYSSVFSLQPRKSVEKVISEFVQSLRKISLVTFKFSTNSFFSQQIAFRFLQTQENIVHFYLKDFSSNVSISSLQNIQSNNNILSQDFSEEKQLLQEQIFNSFYQTITLNKYLLSYHFKNGDANCILQNKGFQQIINFYFLLKKIVIYQIYASKQLLHSEIIKRKEIFNRLIIKFYLNIQSQLNQKILQIYNTF